MKAHIDFLLNGHNVTAVAEYSYSVDDNSILTIDSVYLGGAEVWAMLDDYCKAHIKRCARKDWEHLQSCHKQSAASAKPAQYDRRKADDFEQYRREALDGDLVARNRRAG